MPDTSESASRPTLLQCHPLWIFLAIGALLLTLDALRSGGEAQIRVPAAQQQAGPEVVARWVEEEVLYREAMARGMDAGDTIVRRRLAQKMELALDAALEVSPPSDAELEAWVQERAGRYGEPARLRFDHVFRSRRHNGNGTVQAQLDADPESFTGLGDAHPAGSRVHNSREALKRDFGQALTDTFFELPTGTWQGPFNSPLGQHWVRILERTQAPPVALEAVREQATAHWLQHQREQRLQEQLQALKADYRITPVATP